jgi:spore coat protein SA
MIYHVLPEVEPFSEHHGGALSRWAANVLRGDKNSIIVCPWADSSWGFPSEQVWSFAGLRHFVWSSRIVRSRFLASRLSLLRLLFAPLSNKLQRGDTVYIHNRPEFALALSPICRRKSARIVLHMQNSHLMGWFPIDPSSLDVDAMVFCSAFIKTEAIQYASRAGTAVVIPNGADEEMFFPSSDTSPKEDGEPLVLFVGRLVPAKGVHFFADALGLLLQRGVKVSGKIIGSTGFGHNRTSDFIDNIKRNLSSNVQFADYVSGQDLAEEFRRATIFCCPSVFIEPFGMVNVEAMATRLPVVATAVGGIPEIFRQGGAILVPPSSVVELADAIELLVKNPAMRRDLANQGYQAYKTRFRWQRIRDQYLELVQQVLPERCTGSIESSNTTFCNNPVPVAIGNNLPEGISRNA